VKTTSVRICLSSSVFLVVSAFKMVFFETCGPNEAMVVSGKALSLCPACQFANTTQSNALKLLSKVIVVVH